MSRSEAWSGNSGLHRTLADSEAVPMAKIWILMCPKNLQVPMRRQGPNANTRVPIRSQGKTMYSHTTSQFNHDHENLRVPTKISGSIKESSGSYTTSGLQSWSHYLEKDLRVPSKTSWSRRTSGSRVWFQDLRENLRAPPRPLGPQTTSGSPENLRVPRQPPGPQTTSGSSRNLRVTRAISRFQESII